MKTMNKLRLDGKKVLITGGSKGIGFGIAKSFAQAGADIALLARNEETLEQAGKELADTGREIWTHSFDMKNIEQIDTLYSKILQDTGGIDILVNNAGVTRRAPAEKITLDDWNYVINVNLTSVFVLCRAFGRERIKNSQPGKIINIASLMTDSVRGDNAPYAASKGGVGQLTKSLAIDWAKYGINVNAIGPGYIRTELTKPLWQNPDFDSWVKSRTPLGRWGQPSDLAYTALFLAAPASDFITGQTIYVDGGWLAAL